MLVDSSVWIDYFRGVATRQTELLHQLLGRRKVVTGDLVLTEVLQGFRGERDFAIARRLMTSVPVIQIVDCDSAVQVSNNFRLLRSKGVTVRKTIDSLIATRCIEDGIILLHGDRDFDPFVEHLGLVSALPQSGGRH